MLYRLPVRLTAFAAAAFCITSVCSGRAARADIVLAAPSNFSNSMLNQWERSVPACFTSRDQITLFPLDDASMDKYLQSMGLSDGTSYARSSAGEIDGLFVNRQKRISVRVAADGTVDLQTLSHEYGHYVWFHVLTKDQRKQYRAIYKSQSKANQLVSDYAHTNLEEGFAEAFAFFITDTNTLRSKDSASYQFLASIEISTQPQSPSAGGATP